ncbi:UvrD-helicase domain-containing protein [Cerasicoccus frondis]|uniref:UvrD-helicase domain-containing protein n=1 Tax=Cerasicoccus frondis TaxID=490090 RepID=UPI002852689A|nr:UvrD-helicase domain-containing protein [Cerasicoccus frondis]
MPDHLVKVWRQLRSIDDDELVCRISYQISDPNHPDFLVVYRNRAAFLLAVSSADTDAVDRYFQGDMLDGDGTDPEDPKQAHSLSAFTHVVLQELGADANLTLQHWVLYPKASDDAVERLARSWQGAPRLFLGKQECRGESLLRHFQAASDLELDQQVLNLIVGRFAPEAAIPASWVTRSERLASKEAPKQLDFLLDYDQEAAMKRDLELSSEAFKAASSGHMRLVTGTAGCGKTLILLFRARLSATLNDNQRVLVLMHNKPLRADLQTRAKELGMSRNVEWRTFFSWLHSMLKFSMIESTVRNAFIDQALKDEKLDGQFTREFLLEEFEWISDNALDNPTLGWYLESARTGRKRALQPTQRQGVYRLYSMYRKMLDDRDLVDWPVAPRLFLKKLRDGAIAGKTYHTIYIDEAQFFAPTWFECVKAALHPEYGRLFMAADPTQGFLRSGQSWAQVLGGDMRGRSQRLTKPYRNTREIMSMAKRFYMSRLGSEEDEVNLPDQPYIDSMPSGDSPKLVNAGSRSMQNVLVEQLKQLFESGLNPGNILLIDASGFSEQAELEHLRIHFGNKVVSAAEAKNRDQLRVSTINACTGIESPIVVIIGLDRLFEQEMALGLDDTDREELVRKNTKRVFVAVTRASQKLVVIYKNEATREVLLPD